MEAAMKLARQYFLEKDPPEPSRIRFIAREQSYHGITLGSLSMGGHKYRREKFQPLLLDNVTRVSPCFSYRGQERGESDEQYVARLAAELDDEFRKVGSDTVCAFVAEPVVGAVGWPTPIEISFSRIDQYPRLWAVSHRSRAISKPCRLFAVNTAP